MSVLAALLAQLLHAALMLAAAPLAGGLSATFQAALAGGTAPPPWQPWRDLIRLSHKQAAVAESASPLSRALLPLCFGAMATAALLVPSFTLGMAFARWSDLLAITGLMALSRAGLILAALDPGTAPPGLAAARSAALAWLAEPALLLALLTLGLLGGTTNLDLLIGLQLQGMLQPVAAVALAAAALVLLAVATPDPAPFLTEFAGPDLALAQLTEALRLLVWLDLLGGVFLPLGMAEPVSGPLAWAPGLAAWSVRLVLLSAALAALRRMFGRLQPRLVSPLVQAAAALGAVAALLVLASTVAP
jgi:formate hydrogenlyase subunit 4